MTKPFIVAVDIGTTSTKAAVVDREGGVRAVLSVEYPLHTPAPDRAEQDPDEIVEAAVNAVRAVVAKADVSPGEIRCVVFSAAMHSIIALDADGAPLTRSITWADNRAASYAEALRGTPEGQAIYAATGVPIHPMSPLLKLMWLRERAPDTFGKARKFVGIKEYVLGRWFAESGAGAAHVVDHSIASATGLFNLRSRDWHEPSLALAGIDASRLPTLVPTTHVLEGLPRAAAEKLGLAPGTPVVVGASDGVLANIGAGAHDPDQFAVTIGTSGAVRAVVREPRTDPQGRAFCYALSDDRWVVGGAINNGGVLFRWVRDELATKEAAEARAAGIDPYERLTELAQTAPAGSGGLIVLPLFAGERAPYWNADVRGVFFGLSLAHGKPHMIRAVLEGVGYAVRSVAEAVADAAGRPREIRASGGFARSPFWRQTIADILGAPLTVPDAIESSALGAAALGLVALGDWRDLEPARAWSTATFTHEPNPAVRETYDELYAMYAELYPRLVDPFRRIVQFQSK
ncbi:gluconokinase [Paenibacillus sp.]|uniref:gluconokinase n=1 Tax=Paenibacillus sp. TaxID=58172 RepID=UPI002D31E798|nr:gluconokinase [Paenibacillus sp.]HZG86653.1 gluconokinase [Paenibacillus sp.]